MKKHIILTCLLTTSILFLFNSCSSKKISSNTIKLCEVTHSIFYAPQYVAISQGFFEEQGINLELTSVGGSDKVMVSLLSNNMDVGLAGPETSIYVYKEGEEDYPMFFCQLTKRDGSFLISREDIKDFSWEKVKGKTIIPGRKGGISYMTLQYVLMKNGVNPKTDVSLDDSIQFDLMASAFSSGNADFFTAFEPIASQIEKSRKGYRVTSIGSEIGEIPYTGYIAKQSYIKKNKDLVIKFTKAIFEGQKWVDKHSAKEIADSIKNQFPNMRFEDLSKAIQSYKDVDVWKTSPETNENDFNTLLEIMISSGELDIKISFENIFNTEISESATRK